MIVRRHLLKPPGKRRKKLATEKQRRHLRDLAHRAGVEMPRTVWFRETEEAIRGLEQNLAAYREPTLGPM